MTQTPPLGDHAASAVEVLGALVGEWKGEGHGDFPTMDPFDYVEEIVFSQIDDRVVGYQQRAWAADDLEILHFETGVWRASSDGHLEVTVALPGVAEVSEGSASDGLIRLVSSSMGRATGGAALVSSQRSYEVRGDTLTYDIHMGTASTPLQPHIRAVLSRQ